MAARVEPSRDGVLNEQGEVLGIQPNFPQAMLSDFTPGFVRLRDDRHRATRPPLSVARHHLNDGAAAWRLRRTFAPGPEYRFSTETVGKRVG